MRHVIPAERRYRYSLESAEILEEGDGRALSPTRSSGMARGPGNTSVWGGGVEQDLHQSSGFQGHTYSIVQQAVGT